MADPALAHLSFLHDLQRDMRLWSEHLSRVAGRLAAVGLDRAAEDIDSVIAEIDQVRPSLLDTHTATVKADLHEAQQFTGEILRTLLHRSVGDAP